MKCCTSRAASLQAEKASKIVMLDGTLREVSQGATASHAIEGEPDCIIFDTNKLHVGEYISPLGPDAELEPGQIYMVLPQSMLNHRLDSVDMEKLAVKVKEALLMAAVEKKCERSTSFCGLREILQGKENGEKLIWREEKREKRDGWEGKISKIEGRGKISQIEGGKGKMNEKVGGGIGKGKKTKRGGGGGKNGERKEGTCRYVWYLGFASLPIEDEEDYDN